MRISSGKTVQRLTLVAIATFSGGCAEDARAIEIARPAAASQEGTRIRALLVGCTRYPNLDPGLWLEGGANDAQILEDALIRRFGVPPEQIRSLSGWPEGEALRPTRANILNAMESLVAEALPGEQVLLYLSGHGSQRPTPEADPLEVDGLDELFLPADTRDWDGATGRAENAIVDDEIREWLSRLERKGVGAWLLVDACHSATLSRGDPTERLRTVRRTSGAAASNDPSVFGEEFAKSTSVSLYAAQTNETTPEFPLPTIEGNVHGLFTYSVVQQLLRAQSSLTYRELAAAVADEYRKMGRRSPTPLIEGGGLDREVLGISQWPDRPTIRIEEIDADRNRIRIDAGELHGVGEGSVLAVHPRAGKRSADKRLGYLRVQEAGAVASWTVPLKWDELPAPKIDALEVGARLSVSYRERGKSDTRFSLRAEPADPALAEVWAQITSRETTRIQCAHPSDSANWYIDTVDGRLVVVPAAGTHDGAGAIDVCGSSDPERQIKLTKTLNDILRAEGLLRLANEPERRTRTLALDLELLKEGEAGFEFVEFQSVGRELKDGDRVKFAVRNTGMLAFDLTLLFVDSEMRIYPVFPEGLPNRIRPGDTIQTAGWEVTSEPSGAEQVVAIAVEAVGTTMANFEYLSQPSARSIDRSDSHASLRERLNRSVFGTDATKGSRAAEGSEYAIELLGWKVVDREPRTEPELAP